MGAQSKQIKAKMDEARKDLVVELRGSVDDARIGLGLQAIRQQVDNNLTIALAALEIDMTIENPSYRVHKDPAAAFPEILALSARRDAIDELIEKYRPSIEAQTSEWLKEGAAEVEAETESDWGTEEDAALDTAEPEASGDE